MHRQRGAKLGARKPALSATQLRELLLTHVPHRFVVPSDDVLRCLSSKINVLRADVEIRAGLNRKAHRQNFDRLKALESAYDELQRFLPILEERKAFLEKLIPDAGEPAMQRWTRYLQVIDAGSLCMSALAIVAGMEEWVPPATRLSAVEVKFYDGWPDCLDQLIEDFLAAVRPANPKIGDGKTNGNLNRYLHAIIPFVTGQTPSLNAITIERRRRPDRVK